MILAASAVCFGKMTGVPFTVECRLGRLVEVRLLAMREPDVAVLQEAMRGAFVQVGRKVVICTDLRGIGLLSPTMADLMIGVLAKSNPHLESQRVPAAPRWRSISSAGRAGRARGEECRAPHVPRPTKPGGVAQRRARRP
jgi:hypothetical protein